MNACRSRFSCSRSIPSTSAPSSPIDHEVWTLGEADVLGLDHIPFLSKEVWLDDAHPGRIILTFVWESIESWQHVGDAQRQRELQARFDERFPHRVTLAPCTARRVGPRDPSSQSIREAGNTATPLTDLDW